MFLVRELVMASTQSEGVQDLISLPVTLLCDLLQVIEYPLMSQFSVFFLKKDFFIYLR